MSGYTSFEIYKIPELYHPDVGYSVYQTLEYRKILQDLLELLNDIKGSVGRRLPK